MADFAPAFERMVLDEGGFKLHKVPGDRGGVTYAGITRKNWPNWPGWACIDRGETPPTQLVRDFYRKEYWAKYRCDEITSQRVASCIFNFGVNTSPGVAEKLAQIVAGVSPDGVIGPISVAAINSIAPEVFIAQYTLAKIARYRDIVAKDRSQLKFLLGWINRALLGAS